MFDFETAFCNRDEKPLDNPVKGYSKTSILRTVAFIGDSLSSGEFELKYKDGTSSWHDMFEYSWGQFIARKNGLTAYNFSCGGMSAKWYVESFGAAKGYWANEKACQAYVIAMGVNDIYINKCEIGSVEDIDKDNYKNNKPTFAGFYAQIVSRYKEISPDAKFFFVTFPNENDPIKEAPAKAMRKVLYDLADYFDNSYVIDIYKYGPVYDAEFKKRFFLNGHMNPLGYLFTAEMIDSYIDYIIRHNVEDFKMVGFINKNIETEKISG